MDDLINRIAALGWLLVGVAAVGHGQWVPTTAFGVRDGLAQSQITAIVQDTHGRLWVATQGGLSRHDGHGFHTYTRSEGLPDDVVTCLAAAADGGLWIGFDSGALARWDGAAFTPVELADSGMVTAVLATADGGLLVGTAGALIRVADGVATVIDERPVAQLVRTASGRTWALGEHLEELAGDRRRPPPWSAPPATAIAAVGLSPLGLWIGHDDGTVRLVADDGRELRQTRLDGPVRSLLEADGTLWVGTTSGLWKLAPTGTVERRPLHPKDPNVEVRTLAVDHESNLWIGTWSDGLHRLSPGAFTVFDRTSGLEASTVWSFFEDPEGCVWLGTEDGGVVRWCSEGWDVHLIGGRDIPEGRCLALEGDGLGGFFMATAGGVAHRAGDGRIQSWTEADGLPDSYTRVLHLDRQGLLWAGTRAGLAAWDGAVWTAITETDGLPDGNLRGLVGDHRGHLWMATHNAGVVHYDGTAFTAFGTSEGLPDNRIWCLTIDSSRRLWAGTDAGIWIHPLSGGDDLVIGAGSDLPSLNVLFLHEDLEGLIWAGTTRGVSLIDPEGRILRTLTAHDGLTDSEAAENGVMVDSSGQMWLGLAQGATRLDPAQLPHNPTPPPLVVEAVLANGAHWPAPAPVASSAATGSAPSTVVLAPHTSDLRFEFSALSFTAPEKVRYRFMLEGYDSALGPPTDERHVTYRRVPPGTYRFVLTACNNDGVWTPQGVSLAVQLLPAWYQTRWFRALAILLLVAAAVGGVVAERRGQERRRKALEALVTERTAALAEANRRISQQNEDLQALTRTDPLTGLANRRVLDEVVPLELALIERELARSPGLALTDLRGITLLVVDLDHFKDVNDRHGHEVGDQALVAVATTLARTIRTIDVCARWGGEEFAILARSTDRKAVLVLVRRLLDAFSELVVRVPGVSVPVTASIGFVSCPLSASDLLPGIEWRSLLELADRLMYRAKERGRRRACGLVTSPMGGPSRGERALLEALLADPETPVDGLELVEIVGPDRDRD